MTVDCGRVAVDVVVVVVVDYGMSSAVALEARIENARSIFIRSLSRWAGLLRKLE